MPWTPHNNFFLLVSLVYVGLGRRVRISAEHLASGPLPKHDTSLKAINTVASPQLDRRINAKRQVYPAYAAEEVRQKVHHRPLLWSIIAAKALALNIATEMLLRGPPPPLRSVVGAREEASLVDEPLPGLLQIILRAIVLLINFLPVLLGVPLALCWPLFREKVFFSQIQRALARAGTAFIKWGQWASVRPDMFPERLCAVLSLLHSQAPTHSFEHTRLEVERAMGKPISECFDAIEKKPIASGSIAQIHLAKQSGKSVAVKVRHPAVVSRIVTDFILMRGVADLLARIAPSLNLKQSVDQFASTMVAQTRLDIEAEHLNRFNWNFGTRNWKDVAFPRALFDSRAVLVESFEPGTLMSKYTLQRALNSGGTPLSRDLSHFVVSRGEDMYLKMLLVDNLMHADLHPGNILLDLSGKSPRLVLLDVGMVARLTSDESSAFIGLLHAMGAGDGAKAARVVLRFSEKQTCTGKAARRAFERDMARLFKERCKGFGTNVEFGPVLKGVLSLCRQHRVSLDANYMTLVMNVLCLEGMACALLPEYNVLDAARPLLTAQRRLPRLFFRFSLPLVRRLKGLRDHLWLHSTRDSAQATRTAFSSA